MHAYGGRWSAVADEIAVAGGADRIAGPYTIGEMRYAVRCEMAYTISDLLLRRTHLAFETRDHGTDIAEQVANGVADLLGWNDQGVAAAVQAYRRDVQRVFAIDP